MTTTDNQTAGLPRRPIIPIQTSTRSFTMAQKKNIKAIEADAIYGKRVYVLVCDWHDRHGESAVNEPVVCVGLKKARKTMCDQIENYIDQFAGWKRLNDNDDSLKDEIDYTAGIHQIDYEDESKIVTRADLRKYVGRKTNVSINVDDDGTYANWSISRVKIQ
jgi:hypothetical protein